MTREELYALRFFGTELEIKLFLGSMVLGALLGGVYDLLRALRMTLRHPPLIVFFEDAVFTVFCGCAYYSYCTELCRGEIRLFVLIGAAIGFAAYILTLGRFVSRAVSAAVMLAKNFSKLLGNMLKKLLEVLCGVPFFQKEGDKIEENPCADEEV